MTSNFREEIHGPSKLGSLELGTVDLAMKDNING